MLLGGVLTQAFGWEAVFLVNVPLAAGASALAFVLIPADRPCAGQRRFDEGLGARAVEADVFDEESLRRVLDGADAVVNLLTHIPSADRMADPTAWAENDRLRTEASAAIARAAGPLACGGSRRNRSRSCMPTAAMRGSTRTLRSPGAVS